MPRSSGLVWFNVFQVVLTHARMANDKQGVVFAMEGVGGSPRNVIWESLVDPRNVFVPLLHIKLGLMKQFVRVLNQEPSQLHTYARQAPGARAAGGFQAGGRAEPLSTPGGAGSI